MAHLKFDAVDRRALLRLDPEVAIDPSGEVATIEGDVKVEVTRIAADKFELLIKFPELDFPVILLRSKTLDSLDVKPDDSRGTS